VRAAGSEATLPRVSVETYSVTFATADEARGFVVRLHIALSDVATYRLDATVTVYDSCPGGQREQVVQLALECGAVSS